MELVIDNLTITNTQFSEGLVQVANEAPSVTYQNFIFETVVMGDDSFQAGLLPKKDFGTLTLKNCQFMACSTTDGFIDTSAFNNTIVTLENCRFSQCKCSHSNGFLCFAGETKASVTDCYFGNIRWFEEENENAVPYHLVAAEGCESVTIYGATFDLPQLSFSNLDLFFNKCNLDFQQCSFVVAGDLNVSQLLVWEYDRVKFDHCIFTVENNNTVQPMAHFTGNANSNLEFYNCCFTHYIDEPTESALYLQLEGQGKATFHLVCFDATQERSMVISGITPTFDEEQEWFGQCTCGVDLPEETIESLVSEVPPPEEDDPSKGVDMGLIAGVTVGLLILIIILVLLILFLLWRRRRQESSTTEEPPQVDDAPEETITMTTDEAEVDGGTNDNPLFATAPALNDVFNNEFEEKGSFY